MRDRSLSVVWHEIGNRESSGKPSTFVSSGLLRCFPRGGVVALPPLSEPSLLLPRRRRIFSRPLRALRSGRYAFFAHGPERSGVQCLRCQRREAPRSARRGAGGSVREAFELRHVMSTADIDFVSVGAVQLP